MNFLRFTLLDIKRNALNFSTIFSIVLMPIGFALLFGGMQEYGKYSFRDGNAAGYVMLGMSVFGACSAVSSLAGNAVMERAQGWNRQLALTAMTPVKLAVSKLCVVAALATMSVVAVNSTVLYSQVKIPWNQQLACGTIAVVTSLIFVGYGLGVAGLFSSNRAASIATGLLVSLSFIGTVFSPLPLSLIDFARFTPMYGVAQLVRWPFSGGTIVTADQQDFLLDEHLWVALVNVGAWAIVFALLAFAVNRRATRR